MAAEVAATVDTAVADAEAFAAADAAAFAAVSSVAFAVTAVFIAFAAVPCSFSRMRFPPSWRVIYPLAIANSINPKRKSGRRVCKK